MTQHIKFTIPDEMLPPYLDIAPGHRVLRHFSFKPRFYTFVCNCGWRVVSKAMSNQVVREHIEEVREKEKTS